MKKKKIDNVILMNVITIITILKLVGKNQSGILKKKYPIMKVINDEIPIEINIFFLLFIPISSNIKILFSFINLSKSVHFCVLINRREPIFFTGKLESISRPLHYFRKTISSNNVFYFVVMG